MPVVGEKKPAEFRISNEQLGVIGIATDGSVRLASTAAAKALVERKLKEQVAKVVASSVIPGIGWASWAATAIGVLNAAAGNKGFVFTYTLEYTEFFFNQGGYYVRGWDITNVRVSTY